MLNYNSPIKEKKVYSDLNILEFEPVLKINLRGKKREFIAKIGKILSIIPPTEPNTSSSNEEYSLLWLSPDEWLLYSNDNNLKNEEYHIEETLFNEISKLNYGAVTNVSDHWVLINIEGNKVYDLLSTSCPYNFNNFKNNKGSVIQTAINHIDAIIHNKGELDLNIFVRRSFSEHLFNWLNDSASRL